MELLKLELTSFLGYKYEAIDFSKIHGVTFFTGKLGEDSTKSNGAGKSAIWDAVSWCLFGESRVADDDGLIHSQDPMMSVTFMFRFDNNIYHVDRSKKRGKTQSLKFTQEIAGNFDNSYTGNSIKETQAKIIDVLGMNFDMYEATVFARQGKMDGFASQLPSLRKKMFRAILNIGKYEIWAKEAKKSADESETQCTVLRSAIVQLDSEIKMLTVTDAHVVDRKNLLNEVQAKLKNVEADIAEQLKILTELQASRRMMDREQDTNDQLKLDIDRLTKQISYVDVNEKDDIAKIAKEKDGDLVLIANEDKVRSILDEINKSINKEEEARSKYDLDNQQIESSENEMSRIAGMIRDLEADLVKLRTRLTNVQNIGDKCPFCSSVLDDAKRAFLEESITTEGVGKSEKKNKLQVEYDDLKVKSDILKKNVKDVNAGVSKIKELDRDKARYDSELLNIGIAKNRVDYSETRLTETKSSYMRQRLEMNFEITRKKADLERSDVAIAEYKERLKEVEKIESALESLNQVKSTYVNEERKVAEELHRLEYELETKKKKEEILIFRTVKLDKVTMDLFVYAELYKAFGKDGIPLLIIENALAELQSEVSKQLDVLTDGSVTVKFNTQKELKSGELADALDIIVTDHEGSRDFNLYSGGEKMRVSLSIRLGLAKLLSRRAGKRFDFFAVDEISDLDVHGMLKFVEAINLVQKEFKQVFVISHIDTIKDQFDQVIQVIKTEKDGSKVYIN
jgi:exonuclease SbcC